jgi:carboxylesterase type B
MNLSKSCRSSKLTPTNEASVIARRAANSTKVALGGQSAGAQDTGANMISPAAAGLFNRSIYESGPLPSLATAATALTRGNNFAAAANCSSSARVFTDTQKCQALHVLKLWAPAQATYAYDFTYQHAPYYFPQMPNVFDPTGKFQPLAAHTVDIQFLFDNWHGPQLGVNLDQTSGQPRELQGVGGGVDELREDRQSNGAGAPMWPVAGPASVPFLPGHSQRDRNRASI